MSMNDLDRALDAAREALARDFSDPTYKASLNNLLDALRDLLAALDQHPCCGKDADAARCSD